MKTAMLILLSAVIFLSGCASMKPILPDSIKSIAIPTFVNKTTQYDIQTALTNEVIKQFQMDGRLVVTSDDKADAKLEGTIRQYILQPMLYDVNNVITQYKLKIVFDLRFIDKDGKEIWYQKELGGITGGTTTYNVSKVNIETETEARQRVFNALALATVNRVIYGWENY
jgi:hypothetical protein